MTIRQIDDIDELMLWRAEVLGEVFSQTPDEPLLEANRQYFAEAPYVACIASVDGVDAGCGAICLQREMPSPENPSGRCAYLMNIYVRRQFRCHGVGHSIVRWLIDKARENSCDKIYLETTALGREVYSDCGFVEMKDLLILKQ